MSKLGLFLVPPFRSEKESVRLVRTFGQMEAVEERLLYKQLPSDYKFNSFRFVRTVEEADYILVPQSLRKISERWLEYFRDVELLSDRHSVPIIILVGGDLSHSVHCDNAILFKVCEYGRTIRENVVVMPPYAEDLLENRTLITRKKQAKPTVSFCGYAGFPTLKTRLRYYIKNSSLDLLSIITCDSQYRCYKRGIYFRRKGMRVLEKSSLINTNFIVRSTFSGNKSLMNVDPATARAEFIGNITMSDFVLCPKGDGNASTRLFETLSLGRIPLIIDTDMILPLESILDYSKFSLRIPHTHIGQLSQIVSDFYHQITEEEFENMQKEGRRAFESFLRYDSFFNKALPLLKERGVSGLRRR